MPFCLVYMLIRLIQAGGHFSRKETPAALVREPRAELVRLSVGCRVVSYVMRHRPRVKRMRRIGELVGGRQPRIAEAIAAAARRGPLTLLNSIETAGHHLRRHILAAVFASGRRSR